MAWPKKPSSLALIQVQETNDDVFQTSGPLYSPYSRCSYSPQSRRSSDASSFVSGEDVASRAAAEEVAASEDVLGLKDLFYLPALEPEIARLFFPPGSTPSDHAEANRQRLKSVWDDFDQNGTNVNLDDLDYLLRGMSSKENESPNIDDRAFQNTEETAQDIITKSGLIDILREREQLTRSSRLTPRMSGVLKGTAANKMKIPSSRTCVFCRNNGEAEAIYTSHHLKDPEGNVTCPILYIYTCPICGACGKNAHTVKYCPYTAGEASTSTNSGRFGSIRPASQRPNSFF